MCKLLFSPNTSEKGISSFQALAKASMDILYSYIFYYELRDSVLATQNARHKTIKNRA